MRIVIVGDGKVGYALTEQLSQEDHDIVVIDSNKAVLRESEHDFDVKVVHGNGVSRAVQEEAEVGRSDLLIAATSSDEVNLLCCIIARKLSCPHTIARVRNSEYNRELYFLKDELGLSMMVNPELACAREITRLLKFPSFLQLDEFARGLVEIVELQLRDGNPLIGKQLSQAEQIVKVSALVCAVQRGNDVHIPDGSFRFREGDKVSFTARTHDLVKLIENLGMGKNRLGRSVMIVGGGSNVARYLTRQLMEFRGIDVTLIETNAVRCEQLADDFPKAVVINADGSEKRVLESEGLAKMAALVTLTDIDEQNLIISMYGEKLGVPRVITKVNRTEYADIFEDLKIGRVVSPKEQCTSDIVRFVRGMQNAAGDEAVITLHRIVGGRMEALEFLITKNTLHVGTTLKDITLKPGFLVACINRSGRIIIPHGNDDIRTGDTIIVVTHADRIIREVNQIFADGPRYESRS